jgi:hypothetical protein
MLFVVISNHETWQLRNVNMREIIDSSSLVTVVS